MTQNSVPNDLPEEVKRIMENLHLMGEVALDDAMRYHREMIFAKKVFGRAWEQVREILERVK
jgi:uncharacterized lipoprotein